MEIRTLETVAPSSDSKAARRCGFCRAHMEPPTQPLSLVFWTVNTERPEALDGIHGS